MDKNPVSNEIFLMEGANYAASLVAGHPSDVAVIVGTLVLESESSLVIRTLTYEYGDKTSTEYLIYKANIRYIQKMED